MYRAAALIAIEEQIDEANGPALAAALRRQPMRFDWNRRPPTLLLGDRDISQRIRDLDVSAVVSTVAAQRHVRDVLVEQQRQIARAHPRLVSEGRDQGSVVFPDAAVRFFLHADPEIRTDRRVAQLQKAGKSVDRQKVYTDIVERDQRDTNRADAPLVRPDGAVDIDTNRRSAEQVVDVMESIVRRTVADLPAASAHGACHHG